jgi:hypothetical protein
MLKPNSPLLDFISENRYELIKWNLVKETDLKESLKIYPHLLEDLVINGKWTSMPLKLLKFALTQNSLGNDKLIHFATRKGKFNEIPQPLITHNFLALKGVRGQTVYHILAKNKETNLINENLLTKEVLLEKDDSDITPLHSIIMDNPKIVFKRNLNVDDLFTEDGLGETPLYNWACCDKWFMIPDRFLTKGALTQTENGAVTILDILVQQHKHTVFRKSTKQTPMHSLESIFKKLNNQDLRRLEGDIEPSINKVAKKELTKRLLQKRGEDNLIEL